MNWEQLRTIVWLRSRLSINQWRKAGVFNFVIMMILVVSLLIFAALSFFLAIGLGIFLLPRATPTIVMAVWDILIVVLLFSWTISLMVEIQRMELLSIEKLLHLPMSLRDAFLLNYLSSIVCLNIICFVPAALGLCIALAYTNGPHLLWLIPVLFSFILMLTAVTYQFRGWLASLMSNKRRQRTVIVFFTISFVAVAQLPNIVIQLTLPDSKVIQQRAAEKKAEMQEVSNALARKEISVEEHTRKLAELKENAAREKAEANAKWQQRFESILTTTNQMLPIGWMPYASKQLLTGPMWPALLCGLGMTLIGSLSLWRAYASTVRFYTGNVKALTPEQAAKRGSRKLTAEADTSTSVQRPIALMERSLPKLSEHVSAIALCSIQNLIRAPEAKMVMIGPGILGIMFVLMIVSNRTPKLPPGFEPFMWIGGLAVLTFMCMMLMSNAFGMDRNGFRCFVLMPIRRHDILLGKNIAYLSLIALLAGFGALGMQYIAPVGPLTVIGSICQMGITYLLACLVGNWVSIYFPIAMSPGAGKPVQVNLVTMLVQMAVLMLCPLFIVPGLIFCAMEWAAARYLSISFLPIYAVLSIVELWLAIKVYQYVLERQGRMLQQRETKILEVLTVNTE